MNNNEIADDLRQLADIESEIITLEKKCKFSVSENEVNTWNTKYKFNDARNYDKLYNNLSKDFTNFVNLKETKDKHFDWLLKKIHKPESDPNIPKYKKELKKELIKKPRFKFFYSYKTDIANVYHRANHIYDENFIHSFDKLEDYDTYKNNCFIGVFLFFIAISLIGIIQVANTVNNSSGDSFALKFFIWQAVVCIISILVCIFIRRIKRYFSYVRVIDHYNNQLNIYKSKLKSIIEKHEKELSDYNKVLHEVELKLLETKEINEDIITNAKKQADEYNIKLKKNIDEYKKLKDDFYRKRNKFEHKYNVELHNIYTTEFQFYKYKYLYKCCEALDFSPEIITFITYYCLSNSDGGRYFDSPAYGAENYYYEHCYNTINDDSDEYKYNYEDVIKLLGRIYNELLDEWVHDRDNN